MARIPGKDLFLAGIAAYEQHEGRGTIYFEALNRVQNSWGTASAMTEGVWVLLNSWHRNFYRFGAVDHTAIASCIAQHLPTLGTLRSRSIDTLTKTDESNIAALFSAFASATQRKNVKGLQSSPVAAAKTLHLLAPGFLPLWDDAIAARFGWFGMDATDYVSFCWDMQDHAAVVQAYVPKADDRTILKRIDEYNYAAYTQNWIAWR